MEVETSKFSLTYSMHKHNDNAIKPGKILGWEWRRPRQQTTSNWCENSVFHSRCIGLAESYNCTTGSVDPYFSGTSGMWFAALS